MLFFCLQGDSHTIREYGNIVARDWYHKLPGAVRDIVDEADFGIFCRGLSRLTTCRPLLAALAERWWDTTDSFHFSVAGDMTMTPYDFSMLTGIGVGAIRSPSTWIWMSGTLPSYTCLVRSLPSLERGSSGIRGSRATFGSSRPWQKRRRCP